MEDNKAKNKGHKAWEGCLTKVRITRGFIVRDFQFSSTFEESVNYINRLKSNYPNHSIKVQERIF